MATGNADFAAHGLPSPTKIVGLHSNFLIAPSPSPQAIAQLNEQERKAFLGFKAGEEFSGISDSGDTSADDCIRPYGTPQ